MTIPTINTKAVVRAFEYPRADSLTILLNLQCRASDPDVSSKTLLVLLQTESKFAEDAQLPLAEWLNQYQFSEADFGEKTSQQDAVLSASIIVFGLKLGFPFRFLANNISKLSSGKFDGELDCLQYFEDENWLSRVRHTCLFDRISLEFKDNAKRLVLDLALTNNIGADTVSEAACFSALASFLCQEKIVISVDLINQLRSSRDLDRQLLKLDAGVSEIEPRLALPQIPDTFFHPDLICNPDRVEAYNNCVAAAEKIDKFIAGLIFKGTTTRSQYRLEFLPTSAEKESCVNYFLEHPAELVRLYQTSYQKLEEGFRNRDPQGFHDHDKRHLLFAVPATAMLLAQNADAYTQVFGKLCCLLHDAGRIVESGFEHSDFRRRELAKIHPQVSAAVTSDILDQFPSIPLAVRNEILATVAMHDSGGLTNSTLSVFAQSCDRLQLIGPEYIIRGLGYMLALQGKPFFPDMRDPLMLSYGKSLMCSASFHLHKIYPNYSGGLDLESRLSVATGTFLMLSCSHLKNSYAFFESDILPKANWPSLPRYLRVAIERSTLNWQRGLSLEWPNIGRERSEKADAHTCVDAMTKLPLVSGYDLEINGNSLHTRLHAGISSALQTNPALNIAFEYISKVAHAYDFELNRAMSLKYSPSAIALSRVFKTILE